jgi:hypothetical protein
MSAAPNSDGNAAFAGDSANLTCEFIRFSFTITAVHDEAFLLPVYPDGL